MSMTNTKNHWNTLKNCIFSQTTKQPLNNLSSEYLENARAGA